MINNLINNLNPQSSEQFSEISAVIRNYFDGIYHGDLNKLSSVFHNQCFLMGDINGQPYFKSLTEYLDGVKNRKSPSELGEEFRMKILGIDILNDIAHVRLHVPMLGFNYYDKLALCKVNGQWLIVNKLFTNVMD